MNFTIARSSRPLSILSHAIRPPKKRLLHATRRLQSPAQRQNKKPPNIINSDTLLTFYSDTASCLHHINIIKTLRNGRKRQSQKAANRWRLRNGVCWVTPKSTRFSTWFVSSRSMTSMEIPISKNDSRGRIKRPVRTKKKQFANRIRWV